MNLEEQETLLGPDEGPSTSTGIRQSPQTASAPDARATGEPTGQQQPTRKAFSYAPVPRPRSVRPIQLMQFSPQPGIPSTTPQVENNPQPSPSQGVSQNEPAAIAEAINQESPSLPALEGDPQRSSYRFQAYQDFHGQSNTQPSTSRFQASQSVPSGSSSETPSPRERSVAFRASPAVSPRGSRSTRRRDQPPLTDLDLGVATINPIDYDPDPDFDPVYQDTTAFLDPPSRLSRAQRMRRRLLNAISELSCLRVSTTTTPEAAPVIPTCPLNQSIFSPATRALMPLEHYFRNCIIKKVSGLEDDFLLINGRPVAGPARAYKLPVNQLKCRYGNVACLENTRVKITGGTTDFIHANYVDGYKQSKAFVCCSAPLQQTAVDLWRMIWQENTRVIAMVTPMIEGDVVKSYQYWPRELDSKHVYKSFHVTFLNTTYEDGFRITRLMLLNTRTKEERMIYHCHYLEWPDARIPLHMSSFQAFHHTVRYYQMVATESMATQWTGHENGPPIVVHCSAGLGRAGSFICFDICVKMMEDIQMLNVNEVAILLRTQRAFAISNGYQYGFIHMALLDYAQRKGLVATRGVIVNDSVYQ